jgi:hypothetical protein
MFDETESESQARNLIRQLALKLLDHATSPDLNAAAVLSQCEQTVALAKAELAEQAQPKAGAA